MLEHWELITPIVTRLVGGWQGWAGMTFEDSGTGRELKKTFPKFGNGKGMKKIHSRNSGTGREWKKSIPEIREREGNEKKPFPKFGKGIRGLHSWEWPGKGIPAHPCLLLISCKFLFQQMVVLTPLGGQVVTVGNPRLVTGLVAMVASGTSLRSCRWQRQSRRPRLPPRLPLIWLWRGLGLQPQLVGGNDGDQDHLC